MTHQFVHSFQLLSIILPNDSVEVTSEYILELSMAEDAQETYQVIVLLYFREMLSGSLNQSLITDTKALSITGEC